MTSTTTLWHTDAAGGGRPPHQVSAITSLDELIYRANDIWRADHGEAGVAAQYISVVNPGDTNAYVEISNWYPDRSVAIEGRIIAFDAITGEVLHRHEPQPLQRASTWLEGAHWIQFKHWPLRWLFFLGGLSGCVMIASGLQFWIRARSKKLGENSMSIRIVRALSVGSISGIITATLSFFVVNRLLPRDALWLGIERADLEVRAFFLVWFFAYIHAAIRDQKAWVEQAAAIAALSVSAVILNAVTTGDQILAAGGNGLWSIAMMDLMLLSCAGIAIWSIFRLRKTERLIATTDQVFKANTRPAPSFKVSRDAPLAK